MTHKATLTQSGSEEKLSDSATLADAIEQHCVSEKVSFHTPGHKGGTYFKCGQNLWAMDVTELPGLDELAYANGVLARVQERAAKAFGAQASFISTNGASACLMAAIIACASRNTHILLPRNIHRSAINALVMTGLEPVWYEPEFDPEWNVWGAANEKSLSESLNQYANQLAAVVVVSPTYSGAISDLASISKASRRHNVPLIVDEAHGAHAPRAVAAGADIVVHSLHKTLSAMTQTGLVHVARNSLVQADELRLALNMVQSSSPNYVLMASAESAINEFAAGNRVKQALEISEKAHDKLAGIPIPIYTSAQRDPFHLLVRLRGLTADELFQALAKQGVYAESVLGEGVLLLFGCGSTSHDVEILINALAQIESDLADGTNHLPQLSLGSELYGMQVLSPKLAYFGRTEMVALNDAVGRVAAECVAPCPPGNPVVVPGQVVTEHALKFCKLPALRVSMASNKESNRWNS